MNGEGRRVELILPMRTVLLVAATLGVLAAFREIGDTFLIVFVGIFLGLVFEYPVRFVMEKTHMSRGLAATVTVLGTAVIVALLALLFLVPLVGGVRDFLHDLPQTVEQLRNSSELDSVGDSGAAGNVQSGADQISASVPDAISAVLGIAGDFFGALPGRLHDHLHLPVPAHRRGQAQTGARQRADAGRGRTVARRLGAHHGIDLPLGDRRDRDRDRSPERPRASPPISSARAMRSGWA